jgi:hypothetical protein
MAAKMEPEASVLRKPAVSFRFSFLTSLRPGRANYPRTASTFRRWTAA